MSRSWRWQAALYALLVGLAIAVVLPMIVPAWQLPEWMPRYMRHTMQPSVELVGGIRLTYQMDEDLAVERQVESVRKGLEFLLGSPDAGPTIVFTREGRTDIVVTMEPPLISYRRLREASGGYMDEIERSESTGRIRLRFDPDKADEIRKASLNAQFEQLLNRVDRY
jgi:preprotein translocase subunit SecD